MLNYYNILLNFFLQDVLYSFYISEVWVLSNIDTVLKKSTHISLNCDPFLINFPLIFLNIYLIQYLKIVL